MLIGAGEIAFERQVDEPRVARRELIVAAAEPLHRARPVILQHDIGVSHQAMDHRLSFGSLEIDREAALVAVEGREEAGAKPAEPARVIALGRRLDLDDVGAQLGENEPGGRPHDRVAELQNLEAGERGC
jgi:hypothetical protein